MDLLHLHLLWEKGVGAGSVKFRGKVISPPVNYSPHESPAEKDRARREAVLRTAVGNSLRSKRQQFQATHDVRMDMWGLSLGSGPIVQDMSNQLDHVDHGGRQIDHAAKTVIAGEKVVDLREKTMDIREKTMDNRDKADVAADMVARPRHSSFGRMLGEIGRDQTMDSPQRVSDRHPLRFVG